MNDELIHCIYASTATEPFDAEALARLLHQARQRNTALGLSGMLLHADGSFFQVLEGPAAAVDALFARIERDPRHRQITRIIREPIQARSFSAWTMAFVSATRREYGGLAGLSGLVGSGDVRVDPGRARRLLEAFCRGAWRQRLEGAAAAPVDS